MARYIDAEPLLAEQYESFDRANETDWQKGYWAGIDEMCEKIKAQPSSDVVEVVHGEWERIPYSFAGGYRCSCCGCKSLERHWKYCPECGAVMDGKKVE